MAWVAIVKKIGDHWEIDQDSAHIFEDDGGNCAVQEIEITQIWELPNPYIDLGKVEIGQTPTLD